MSRKGHFLSSQKANILGTMGFSVGSEKKGLSLVVWLVFALCFLGFSAVICSKPLFAAERMIVGTKADDVTVVVQESNDLRTVVHFEIGVFTKEAVQIGGETYYKIGCGEEGILLNAGEPALPRICRSIIIPDNAKMKINILSVEYSDFPKIRVVPSKGNLLRTVNPDDVPYTFGPVYKSREWYPAELASIREPFILRDFRGTVIELNAFQYHPGSQVLRVYTSVTVEVVNLSPGEVNVLQRRKPFIKVVPDFNLIYERRFINYGFVTSRYEPVMETGHMLIITYDDFHAAMLPFVEWKKQKGIPTAIVDVSTIGNNSYAIKNYIHDIYNNGDLAWVLLVGDATQVATPMACGGSADPTYAKLEGNDYYPDIFVGRFSAERVAHVETQVERTIEYEKFPQVGARWYHKGMGIASDKGPGHNGEYDWEHMDLIRLDLLSFTYTEVDRIYDPGALPRHVRAPLNLDGRSVINYCGHGSRRGWTTSGFSNLDVNVLFNVGMLPFIFSVACLNGQFAEGIGPCFAETWLRARLLGGEPTGALVTYMSSIKQYWDPPMDAQDEAVDLLCSRTNTTFGGICFNGSCKMIDNYGWAGDDMFSTWHIFGDPSVQLRTDTPAPMLVEHEGWVYFDQSYYDVEVAGVDGALCALYFSGTLYGSAYIGADGQTLIPISQNLPVGENLILTVTAFNKLNYTDDVQVLLGDDSCEYLGRCLDDMYLYWHEENPPSYYYTEETNAVRDGEGGLISDQDRIWFMMDMGAEETRCHQSSHGWMCGTSWHNFGLIACYDPSMCDTLYTIRLPEYGSAMPQATYHGLAYNDNDATFWYSRPIWPVTMPPSPPRTTIYHIDASGNELGSFLVDDYAITGLAFDADHDHLWCIARGDPDLFLEYDISSGVPVLIQGPFEVPWSSPDNSAAGLEYDEEKNALVAIDKNTNLLAYFCDVDQDYPGPPGSDEPEVTLKDSCELQFSPWGIALVKNTETAYVASSSGHPYPLDIYASLAGCPRKRVDQHAIKPPAENERKGLDSHSYPNPFNPATEISYVLPNACQVKLSIYNLLGQRIRTLVDEYQAAGHKTVRWDGMDEGGNKVASGIYLYRIQAGEFTDTRKMIMLK